MLGIGVGRGYARGVGLSCNSRLQHIRSGRDQRILFADSILMAVNLVQTLLVFVVTPAVIYGLLGVFTMRSKFASTPRHRPGQDWTHPPVWWSANPAGLGHGHGHGHDAAGADDQSASGAQTLGGARGSW